MSKTLQKDISFFYFIKDGFEFLNFLKKRRGSDFSHKKGGVGKIGKVFLKRGYHLFPY